MGQKRREDKIGTLSHGGGNITLASSSSLPSYLTIGGQQYKLTANLSVAVASATANTLYMVYAKAAAGVVSLVKSTNTNSVGPAGETSWKLIGAFYTAAADTWGSFVNIEGTPTSGQQSWSFTSSFTTNNVMLSNGIRDGKFLELEILNTFTGTPGAGSGTYTFPAALTQDITNFLLGNGLVGNDIFLEGDAMRWDDSAARHIAMKVRKINDTSFQIFDLLDDGTVTRIAGTSIGAGTMANEDIIYARLRIPITQWSSTPLKDL